MKHIEILQRKRGIIYIKLKNPKKLEKALYEIFGLCWAEMKRVQWTVLMPYGTWTCEVSPKQSVAEVMKRFEAQRMVELGHN